MLAAINAKDYLTLLQSFSPMLPQLVGRCPTLSYDRLSAYALTRVHLKLSLLARMGDIFITVGDLFACGKTTTSNSAR